MIYDILPVNKYQTKDDMNESLCDGSVNERRDNPIFDSTDDWDTDNFKVADHHIEYTEYIEWQIHGNGD